LCLIQEKKTNKKVGSYSELLKFKKFCVMIG
jgi:hypothetical protein